MSAAAIIEDGRLLLVSKRAAPDVFYLPGGKPDPGEGFEACVRREVLEELGAELDSVRLAGIVTARAALEGVPMEMTVYLAELAGPPRAAAEIADVAWYEPGVRFDGILAPAVAEVVVPELRARGLLPG